MTNRPLQSIRKAETKILEGIAELNRNGATIIYTSHYMEEVEQLCTRIAIMDKGKKSCNRYKRRTEKMIKNTETVTIEVLDLEDRIISKINDLPHVYEVSYNDNKLMVYCAAESITSCVSLMY